MTADDLRSRTRTSGDVTFRGGVYEIVLKSRQRLDGEGRPSGGAFPIAHRSHIRSTHDSPAVFGSETGVVLLDPSRLPAALDPGMEIRFEVPRTTLRRPVAAEVEMTLWLQNDEPSVDYMYRGTLSAEGHNRYIQNPALKLGRYENGERVAEIDNILAPIVIQAQRRRGLLALIRSLAGADAVAELDDLLRPAPELIVGEYTFPAEFLRQEFKEVQSGQIRFPQFVQTPVTRDVTRTISQRELPGAAVVLHTPRENGSRILWSWRVETDTIEAGRTVQATGSPADGNPVIWGAKPYVEDIVVLNAQEARGEDGTVLYPWPGETGEAMSAAKDGRAFFRDILVVGRDLDVWEGRSPLGNLAAVSYGRFRKVDPADSASLIAGYDGNAPSQNSLEAVNLALRRDPSLTVLHVGAAIEGPVEAQPVLLKIDGESGQWPLLFGDHNGQIAIVRIGVPAPDTFEKTLRLGAKEPRAEAAAKPRQTTEETADPVFFRDEIVFEATFDEEIEAESVALSLLGGGEGSGVGAERDSSLILSRVPDDPKRFRSKPYLVVEAAADADPSDGEPADDYADIPVERSLAWPNDTPLRPRLTSRMTARPFPDAPVRRARAVQGDFIQALKRAAACARSPVKADWDGLSLAEEFDLARGKSDSLVTSAVGFGQDIATTLGQHAAMIMMRDAYVEIASPVLAQLNTYASLPETNARLWRLTEDLWLGENSHLSTLEDRSGESLADAVARRRGLRSAVVMGDGDAGVGTRAWISKDDVRHVHRWLRWARADLDASMTVARSAGDCDLPTLVLLTSIGFDPIVDLLQARVTRLETYRRDGIKRRQPDVVGRRELEAVSALHRRYAAEVALVDEIWLWIKTSASVISAGAGLYAAAFEASSLAYGALVVSELAEGFDAVTTCYDAYCGATRDATRLDFAEGAAYLFGADYLKAVEDTTTSNFYRGFETLVQLSGGLLGAADLYKAYNAQTLLSNADTLRKTYGSATQASRTKGFRGIAQDFWTKAKTNPALLAQELDPKTSAALTEFLGTPAKFLTKRYRQVQKELHAALTDTMNTGWAGALAQKANLLGAQKAAAATHDAFDLYGVGANLAGGAANWARPPAPPTMPEIRLPPLAGAGSPGGSDLPDIQLLQPSFEIEAPTIETVPVPGLDAPEITLQGGQPSATRSGR
ncbi:hypothetical protein [Amorphus coralli]|uniref:hypothetical protein n=1 Tax=Amorphus coralli TaxID=340680 RepID=UPI0003605B9B|nr:hypothetical protein [Amorphus coralli]